jgi:predicted AlkP superfamily pyrophosphatase or phosphodiesterase
MRHLHTGLLSLALLSLTAELAGAAENEKPRLLVLIVFDQMRGDYPERWESLYGERGFRRLAKEGAWFTNCHYPYAVTTTGPGHASMLTGCSPDRHGIINNEWYDRKSATIVNCAESERYQRVPPLPKILPKQEFKKDDEPKKADGPKKDDPQKEPEPKQTPRPKRAGSPDFILAPTLADALKEATGGKARVVGLSFKDRSAILPTGKSGDAVYWLDSADGMIVTSSCYRDSVHSWVAEFNAKRVADQWFGTDWTKLLPDLDYEKFSGPDKVAGEGKGVKQGISFPHPTDGGLIKPGKSYYEALFNSPFGNDMLADLARRAIVSEHLGKNESTDLLVVSFSSNDAVGHTWGPDSQEVLDVTLRSDRMLAEFLTFLDKEVGKGKYLVVLSADHGICPLPEVAAQSGKFAQRISARKLLTAADEHLRSTFDKEKPADPKLASRWIETARALPWIYLNQRLIDDRGLKSADVAQSLSDFLAKQEGVYRTFTRADLEGDFPVNDPIGQRMKRSYYPDRSGDVAIVIAPFCLFDSFKTGTNHGSPHPYDTHVPLMVFGPGIKPGIRKEPVTPQMAAAIFAEAAGIKPPAKATYPVPEGLFEMK